MRTLEFAVLGKEEGHWLKAEWVSGQSLESWSSVSVPGGQPMHLSLTMRCAVVGIWILLGGVCTPIRGFLACGALPPSRGAALMGAAPEDPGPVLLGK